MRVNRRKIEKGSSLVESSLVLLTLVCIIIFVVDMGRMLLTEQFITERVRLAARTAAVSNWTSADVANFVCYNSTTAPGNDATTPGFLGLLPSNVTYTVLGSAGAPDYRVQVTVSGVPMLTMIPFMSGSYSAPPIKATMPAGSLGSTS